VTDETQASVAERQEVSRRQPPAQFMIHRNPAELAGFIAVVD
jgi:hypothetical protein